MRDYYGLLGVPHDASEDDIKKAYRRRVLECHPDKLGNTGDLSNIQIYDINEAFSVLKDAEKRKKYDMEIMFSNQIFNTSLPVEFTIYITTLLINTLKIIMTFKQQHKEKTEGHTDENVTEDKKEDISKFKGLDIDLVLNVTLEDLYLKRIKKLKVMRYREGKREFKTIYISLLNYQDKYTFKNEGDNCDGCRSGDINVSLKIENHDTYILDTLIDKYDLWMECNVSLYEYYYGKKLNLKLLDDTFIEIDIPYFNQRNMVHLEKGYGLPYYNADSDEELQGDLYISFKLVLKELDETKLEDIELRKVLANFL
jgi:DnaJ-class molecular chaperone